jgi:hypothetical protein
MHAEYQRARYKNCAQQVIVQEPKFCAWWILARDTKVVRTSYWHDKEVMHSGYRCAEHDLPCGVVVHAKYGCTG